jgi:hypothetical protein
MTELPALTVADAAAWRDWLGEHHLESSGVWLALAKKGASQPTSLSYEEAVREALCFGWIDGQARGGAERSYSQRFTPRRPRSNWSRSNVLRAEQLIATGRMQAAGLAAIESARRDGRWPADADQADPCANCRDGDRRPGPTRPGRRATRTSSAWPTSSTTAALSVTHFGRRSPSATPDQLLELPPPGP